MTGLTPVDFTKGRAHAARLSPVRVPGRHSDRFWTEAQEAVLREHYSSGGVAVCRLHLAKLGAPARGTAAVYNRARSLGLHTPRPISSSSSPKDLRTPEMDQRIRDGWAEMRGRGAVARFADELGIPRTVLSARALQLGLTQPHKKEPPWTSAEESLLPTLPLHDLKRASRVMREHGFARTPAAIGIRAKRLSISRRRSDVFSGTRAARLLGLDNKTITAWCVDGTMPATRRGTARLPQQGGDTWSITPADLRQWIIDNLDRIDIRKVDKHAFVALLVTAPANPDVAAVVPIQVATSCRRSAEISRPPRRPRTARPKPRRRSLEEILADCGRQQISAEVRHASR